MVPAAALRLEQGHAGRDWTCELTSSVADAFAVVPVSVKKHSSGEEDTWEIYLCKHQTRGWKAVSAAVL